MHIFPRRAALQELGVEIFKLVSYSATPEQWAEWLRVPLEHAAARGNLGLVDMLLQAGADGSAGWRGCRGRTLLDAAAVGGNADVVTALLRKGAQPDVKVVSLSPKRSALYAATLCGHEEVARRLILAGADVRFEDPVDRYSVLHEAACGGHEQIVIDLLIGGADPNCLVRGYGTPLHQAVFSGYAGIISALLLSGANKDAIDRIGSTPLISAAGVGRLAAVETLLVAGADFTIRSSDETSALDLAASKGHIDVIKTLLGHGADINSRDSIAGCSALCIAASLNQAGAIEALVQAGADIDLKDNDGDTALMEAACTSGAESMLALLKRGAAVTMCNEKSETPLHRACQGRYPGLDVAVDLLLRWGADETASYTDGTTPAADLLSYNGNRRRRCSQEEIDRTRLLLARAPVDRAWRRRSWLVMLRSRTLKAGSKWHDTGSNGAGGSSDIARGLAGESYKLAKTQGTAGSAVEHDSCGRMNTGSNRVEGVAGAGAKFEGLSGIVALLSGLEVEGVFRTIVGFL